MSGIRIAALYGIYPFELGLCGPRGKETKQILSQYLSRNDVSEQKVKSILREFKGAYPYYQLIARSNGINDSFDEKVVRAYWIGNELLENVSIDSLKKVIVNFSDLKFLSQAFLQEKVKRIPIAVKPYHSFHVYFIGSVTGIIKLEGKSLDVCRVSWGEVIKKENDKIIIKYQPIKKIENQYVLADFVKKNILWKKDFLPKVAIGDYVSCHWNHVVEVINQEDVRNLKKYTGLTLSSIIE